MYLVFYVAYCTKIEWLSVLLQDTVAGIGGIVKVKF